MKSLNNVREFLLVDDDKEFSSYFVALVAPYSVKLDICYTLRDAREKIGKRAYHAYIIDLNLPDGSGVEFIKEIRQTESNRVPIVAISGIFRDEKMFKLLRDQYGVDYILDKPIYPHQLDKLLFNLLADQKKEQKEGTSSMLDTLGKEYLKTIGEKITLLTELVEAVEVNLNQETLTALRNAVHKIAGSAGSYGFAEASSVCKDLEVRVREVLNAQKISEREQREFLASLDVFLSKIKYHFQFSSALEEESFLNMPQPFSRPALYVIDSDAKFLELLQKEKEEFDLTLIVETVPERALAHLKEDDFNPRVIVSSQTFFGSSIHAFDLMAVVRQKQEPIPNIFALLLEEESIEKRMEAISKGVDYIFQKPISAQMFLKSISEVLEMGALRNFKALIVDDDPDVCAFIAFALSEIGIESHSIESPTSLYPILQEYSPNLLFLDVRLPTYDGFDLLKVLRADMVYRHLLIVMITGAEQSDAQFKTYSGSADEILYKPLDKKILQKCVLNLAKRSALLSHTPAQERVGLLTFKTLLKKVHEILVAALPYPSYLVLFCIDRYNDLVRQKGQAAVNELIVLISNFLQHMERGGVSCYFSGSASFALIFNRQEKEVVEQKIRELFTSIQRQASVRISLSSSVVPISKELGDSHAIIRTAEEELKEAEGGGDAPVKIITHAASSAYKKSLVIVEPNEDLASILKTAFSAQNLDVKVFHEGKIALKELLESNEACLPSLIIVERKLPDMDGAEILKGLHMRFKSHIPFYFLTDFVAEKDVAEGLRLGALEYVTKPFSLSLLVQKSLKVIFEMR